MTYTLTFTLAKSYVLDPDLRESVVCDAVQRTEPDEASREELVLRKLGKRGWGRLNLFRYHYNQGWGQASRPALSPRALDAFFRFLKDVNFPPGRQPSVFLTDEGSLELVWEDVDGQSVQVDFRPNSIEYYCAASDEGGEAPFSALQELARRFSV